LGLITDFFVFLLGLLILCHYQPIPAAGYEPYYEDDNNDNEVNKGEVLFHLSRF